MYFALFKETKTFKISIYTDKYDSFQAPLYLSLFFFFLTKYFIIYSDYYMIMVQKLHSV